MTNKCPLSLPDRQDFIRDQTWFLFRVRQHSLEDLNEVSLLNQEMIELGVPKEYIDGVVQAVLELSRVQQRE